MDQKENDERIKSLMKKVTEKKEALGTKPRTVWKTNGLFKFTSGNHFNLNVVADKNTLIDALAQMIYIRGSQEEAYKLLGVTASEFVYSGYSFDDWVSDFKLRISIIQWEAEKKKLEEMEKQLAKLISADAQTEMALDEISKALK